MDKKIVNPRNYQGTRDWLAADVTLRQFIVSTLTEVFQLFGYEPLETPVIELREVLAGKYGTEGDSQTYYFSKGSEDIGLRYDQTVPLARVVAQHLNDLVLPYRRYVIGPVFRADKPQKGRSRQFTQCDFDTVGTNSPIADAEVIAINYTALQRLGFKGYRTLVCDRRLLNAMAQEMGATNKDQTVAVLRSWDKIGKASREQIAEELEKAGAGELIVEFNRYTDELLKIRETANPLDGLRKFFANSPSVLEAVGRLEQLEKYILDLGVPKEYYAIDPTLARGLDYYTGPIFETVVTDAGIGSITGGGRFDNLIADLGGPSLPATGSSFGLERIQAAMEALGIAVPSKTETQVFVATFGNTPEAVARSIKMASVLRTEGIKTEIYMGKDSIGKQLQLADRRGIPYVVFAGPDEVQKGLVIIKDLTIPLPETGKDKVSNQSMVPEEGLVSELKAQLSNR